MAAAAPQVTQEALGLAPPPGTTETAAGLSLRSVAPPAPMTLSQAEKGSTAGEGEEERRKATAKELIEGGGAAVVFGFSTLFGCLRFLKHAMHESSVPLCISSSLAWATFVNGIALVLLGVNMLGLRSDLGSGGQYVAANPLAVSCTVLLVLTLLSLVALPRSRKYQYIGLAAVTAVLLPAAGVHWYLRRRTGGSDQARNDDEHREELEATSKITSGITNSAFGFLVLVLFSASQMSGAAADAVNGGAYVAIVFLLFAAAVLGMFLMTVSKKVPGITEPRHQRLSITAIRLANSLLLCTLACAALVAAFVVLGYGVLAAFAPLVITGIVCFLLQPGDVRRLGRGPGEAGDERGNQHEQVKEMEDLASKVTLGGIMSVLAGCVGGNDNNQQPTGVRDALVVVLASAVVSGLGVMLVAGAAPVSARARASLAPATKVLVWSSVALFAVAVGTVYGLEVS